MNIGYLRRDEDCHWYLIPEDKVDKFDKSKDNIAEAYQDEEFEKLSANLDCEFGKYRIDHPFRVQCLIEEEK